MGLIQAIKWDGFTGANFELSGGRLRLIPVEWRGNRVGFYLPLDDASDLTNKSVVHVAEIISGLTAHAAWCQSQATIGFGAASIIIRNASGAISLPRDTTNYANKMSFTHRLKYKCPSITGVAYILNEMMNFPGAARWYLARTTRELVLTVIGASGSSSVTTTDVLMSIGTTYEIEISYNGTLADGSCLAVIKVDGVVRKTSSTMKLIASPSQAKHCLLNAGGYFTDNANNGSYALGGEDEMVLNEWVMSPTYNADAYTPAVSRLLPFPTSAVATCAVLDSGAAGTTWDMSAFGLLDEADATHLRFRAATGESSPPTLSGDVLTLAELKALDDKTGRYFILEVSTISDGLTQVYIPAAFIGAELATVFPPATPVIDFFARTGDTGTTTISGANAGDTVNVYAIDQQDETVRLIGSRTGSGAITLDFSEIKADVFGISIYFSTQLIVQSENGGLYSELVFHIEKFSIEFPARITVTYTRLATSAELKFTGLVEGDHIHIIYLDPQGSPHYASISDEDGTVVISSLYPIASWKYVFDLMSNDETGQTGILKMLGDFQSAPSGGTSIREQIVEAVVAMLETISPANGYDNTVYGVSRIRRSASGAIVGAFTRDGTDRAIRLPHLLVITDSEAFGQQVYRVTDEHLKLTIVGWMDDSEVEVAAHSLVADIEKAVQVDETWGGLAWQTVIVDKTWDVSEGNTVQQRPLGLITVSLLIKYRHKYGLPKEQ